MTASAPAPGTIRLEWSPVSGADGYAVLRGSLDLLPAGDYGGCLADAQSGTTHDDLEQPLPGEGYAYLVQAWNLDCGGGDLGLGAGEIVRLPGDGCTGPVFTDVHAVAEQTVYGTVAGGLAATQASDDLYESLTEEAQTTGPPSSRYSRLEHRWTFDLPAGGSAALHAEGMRTSSPDGDDFVFELSTDGGTAWSPVALPSLPLADDGADLSAVAAAGPLRQRADPGDRHRPRAVQRRRGHGGDRRDLRAGAALAWWRRRFPRDYSGTAGRNVVHNEGRSWGELRPSCSVFDQKGAPCPGTARPPHSVENLAFHPNEQPSVPEENR